ncbi:GNAT family N-acetyltransferase [Aquimarina muelleri]|uniref:N-acetyltransferase n=1 Tax=Aquimarina muelleri TaxID=279356 RepID=A0A918JST5_9FLAO|nr:GNAT family protein [Aquimarina muelleri]MCX2762105.1 GNAT family N-acetyltransferase [Aquimarina muelleri]GGX04511.1 N-acetyltransferase [Aquimarina muelleri]
MKTENYFLKEIESSDIKNIHKGLSNPDITKYYAVHFPTIEDTKEQMDWYRDLKKNGTGIWWGIYDKNDNQFCGAGGFNNLEKNHKKAEIGLWLLKEYWGKGILKEIMPKLFEEGFNKLDLNRIEGFVASDNLKCKNGLEKINFTYEGTMRECEIKNGEKIDVDFYSILKREWMQK